MPASAVLFANLFLVYVILKTSSSNKTLGVGVWKSKQLPMFFNGLDERSSVSAADSTGLLISLEEMEEQSGHMLVRFRKGVDGIKLRIS
jgi:hypothetical protein